MTIARHLDLPLRELLEPFTNVLKDDFERLHNHLRRELRYFDALVAGRWPIDREDMAILLAYHDIGIWTHGTFDYLGPSRDLTRRYLTEIGRTARMDDILAAIENHHKLTPYRGPGRELVEPFRQADWTDVTAGWRRFGLPRALVREVEAEFPDLGFRRRLVQIAKARAKARPWSPLPLLRL